MLCALIMAGGKGERFWPLSTDEKPKQFLRLLGDKTMIQMTVERLKKRIPIERIFVITGRQYVDILEKQLPELPEDNVIVEPVGRNTAPCIGLSAFIINKRYRDAYMVVLPSDHLVVNEDKFLDTVNAAYGFVKSKNNAVVTLGIKPSRAETDYGYIKFGEEEAKIDGFNIDKVEKFVEKPNKARAKKYLKNGSFLWNGGMFIWKCSMVLDLIKRHLSNTYHILSEIAVASETEFEDVLEEKYYKVDNISVDYGIMEKAENIYVIPSDFGWDDIGTWYSVERYNTKDVNNNVYVGKIKSIESKNNIVVGKEKPIVVVGLSDVFVVESDNIIFIGKKEDIEKIKEIKNKVIGQG